MSLKSVIPTFITEMVSVEAMRLRSQCMEPAGNVNQEDHDMAEQTDMQLALQEEDMYLKRQRLDDRDGNQHFTFRDRDDHWELNKKKGEIRGLAKEAGLIAEAGMVEQEICDCKDKIPLLEKLRLKFQDSIELRGAVLQIAKMIGQSESEVKTKIRNVDFFTKDYLDKLRDFRQALLDSVDANGQTALHIAAKNSSASDIRFLVEHGAKGDVEDRWNDTPFEWACEDNRKVNEFECVKLLFAALLLQTWSPSGACPDIAEMTPGELRQLVAKASVAEVEVIISKLLKDGAWIDQRTFWFAFGQARQADNKRSFRYNSSTKTYEKVTLKEEDSLELWLETMKSQSTNPRSKVRSEPFETQNDMVIE